MEEIRGQVVKVATTVDECVRITIDIENQFIPDGVNILRWKNNMVKIQIVEAK